MTINSHQQCFAYEAYVFQHGIVQQVTVHQSATCGFFYGALQEFKRFPFSMYRNASLMLRLARRHDCYSFALSKLAQQNTQQADSSMTLQVISGSTTLKLV